MFNFWFSEFVIPIAWSNFFAREMNRENCNRSKNLSIVCLRFPVVFTQMFVSSLPSASPDPSIGCTDLSGNTKRKEKNTGINFGPEIVGNNGAKRNTSVFSLLFIIAFWLSRVWKALHWLHVIRHFLLVVNWINYEISGDDESEQFAKRKSGEDVRNLFSICQ